MFEKVLIAEDHQMTNISLQLTLDKLDIQKSHAYQCDEAFTQLNKAIQQHRPFDLLITDFYFNDEEQYIDQTLKDGMDLVTAAKHLQPDLKVLVFSAEGKSQIIEQLFQLGIDAYVRKGRHDADYLMEALHAIAKNQKYRSPNLWKGNLQLNQYDFTSYDIAIISQLANGTLQKNIPFYLQQQNIKPTGLSSIEKRLNLIKEALNLNSNEQLIAYCKDNSII